MKQRMSSVDVAAEVACLNEKLLGLRVANVYDLNPKTYVLKLAKSGADGGKFFLLLESGSRFHTTEVMQEKNDIPSNFTLKLRKHMRTRRLEAVRQLGVDRMVDFVFGSGEATYHLILEMYSQGNIVLTDSKFEVLTLLRSHRDDEKGFAVMARHPYPMHAVRLRQEVQEEELASALEKGSEEGQVLKATLANLLPYGPAIAEHCIIDAGLEPGLKLAAQGPQGCAGVQKALMPALKRLDQWFAALEQGAPPGFITVAAPGGRKQQQQPRKAAGPSGAATEPSPAAAAAAAVEEPEVYQDFNPLRLRQSEGLKTVQFPTFDQALEDFFSKIAGQRAAVARSEAERSALGKLDRIRHDQSGRVVALQREADESDLKAAMIEYNLEAVDAAMVAVNEALASGMDWRELDHMIRDERKAGNPVACLIHSLQLDCNKITLLLGNYLDEDGDDEAAMTRPASKVQVDLSLSAHSNACTHYETRKRHVAKQAKTLAANEAALKAAEKKALQQLQQVRSQPTVAVVRKPYWFERFHWFITSENYLVISGRDAQQNELIVKRYFKRGDAYVHAELHGASSTIIKNPTPERPVPPITLQQAGCACVCRSRAWDSKIVTSAWWVHHHQVSKTAPTGEFLPTGSFMIRGRKNFLPPQPLVFGFGFMFKLEEGSIAGHLGERAPRLGPGEEGGGPGEEAEENGAEEEEEGEGEGSALERFMEGGYDPLARAVSGGTSVSVSASSRAGSRAAGGTHERHFQRYGLDVAQAADGGGVPEEEATRGREGEPQRRHLSAKEREQLKKGKPVEQQQQQQQQRQPPQQQGEGGRGAATPAPAPAASSRGKRGKQHKIKERYADQDEEERELAISVLASQGDRKSRTDRRKERKERKEVKRAVGQADVPGLESGAMQEAIEAATKKQFGSKALGAVEEGSEEEDAVGSGSGSEGEEGEGKKGGEPGGAGSGAGEAVVAGEGSGEGEGDAAGGGQGEEEGGAKAGAEAEAEGGVSAAERAEIAALLAEEQTGPELGEEERERLTVLDSLTGVPRAEDLLLGAIPVCAPYQALNNFKFKVKLTPGTVKKGKAARQTLDLLIRGGEVNQRERELLKASPEMDMINAMVGMVKISMPGLQKLKQAEKSNRKSRAKAVAQQYGLAQ